MYSSILVPIDISEKKLNMQMIPHVQNYALNNSAKVHFLTVIPAINIFSSLGLSYPEEFLDINEIQWRVLSKLDTVVAQFKIPPSMVQTYIATGSPKDEILKLADKIGADLIIMSSRAPDLHNFIGSNVSTVIRHAKCSVLVIK
jgi:universal stress protein F